MKCTICKTGETHPGLTTVTLQREQTVVVLRDVPAEICEDCDEYYLDQATARHVYADAEDGLRYRVDVEINGKPIADIASISADIPSWKRRKARPLVLDGIALSRMILDDREAGR